MDASTLDFNTITLMVMIAGSWLTLGGMIVFQSNRLDTKFDTKIDALAGKFDTKIDALDGKFDTKIDALDTKIDTKIDALDTKIDALDTKIDALDTKFDGKFDLVARDVSDVRERLVRVEEHMEDHGRRLGELGESSRERGRVLGEVRERLARVEGHLMGPESFSPLPLSSAKAEPDDGERQAG